ncbi:MAG TPA: phytanoyl-CoA dioxygenase family protein [Alphaproteobacteria bacterium]|nr:phytanoyl-CoA dioxygenase family protein [Alphaproteobacteria bacterium]
MSVQVASTSLPQAALYREQGFLFPIQVMSPEEAGSLASWLEALPKDRLAGLEVPWVQKSYLLFPALDAVVRNPAILDAVEALFGPDLLVLSADLFMKPPRSERRISWHQDVNYWGLEPMEVLTAWVALTDATPENGCMRFSPGGHKRPLPHNETYAADNMLSRGQEIAVEISEAEAVNVVLSAGQASLHDGMMPHASGPNRTDGPRIAFAIRYAPAHIRQTSGPPMSVTLVRGRDFGHFTLEERPRAELDAAAIAAHRNALMPHAATRFSTI